MKIYVLHENTAWVEPLRVALHERGLSFEEWFLDTGTLDLDRGLDGLETDVTRYTSGCRPGGAAELWTINGGGHGPAVSDHFSRLVVEWLLAHPKP